MSTWIRPLQAVEKKDKQQISELVLLAPNEFILRKIQKKYLNTISNAIETLTSSPVGLSLSLSSRAVEEQQMHSPTLKKQLSVEERRKKSLINPFLRFDNFVCGHSNSLAHDTLFSSVGIENFQQNLIFIYANASLGKTHLLNAVGNKILEASSCKSVYLLQTYHFTQMVVSICINRDFEKLHAYKKKLDCCDILLVDDLHLLEGKKKSQEEFSSFLKAFLESGRQVVICCNQSPAHNNFMHQDLSVCLHGGLSIQISPPDIETRVRILKQKSIPLDFLLSDDIAVFLAEKIPNNLRLLEGTLNHLNAQSGFHKKSLSKDFVEEVLADILPKDSSTQKSYTIEQIQQATAEYFRLDIASLKGKRRSQNIVFARQIAIFLVKNLTQKSHADIGACFGGRDRATIIYSCKKIDSLIKTETSVKKHYSSALSAVQRSNK